MSVLQQTKPTPYDRLGLTLCIAILIHALIVFGVTFTKEDRPNMRFNTMDIILVKQETKTVDKDSDVLAQKNLEGGGVFEEVETPATSVAPKFF
jgi:hypothetical protein